MVSQTVVRIYENYLEQVRESNKDEACCFGGLMRIFSGKHSDVDVRLLPNFDARLMMELNGMAMRKPESAVVRELAEWMLDEAAGYNDEPRIKYSFMVAQRHLLPLIGKLNRKDAAYLAEKFKKAYPERERFPIHKELIANLKKQSEI